MSPIISALRDGAFLTEERLRLWAVALLIGFAAGIAFLFITAHGLNDYQGRPLGTDFSDVYAAGWLADHGHADAAFDPPRQFAQEQQLFGRNAQFYGWHYPPLFLLVAAPLARLPYLVALILFQLVTLGFYLVALRRLLGRARGPTWLLLALGFPAVFVNLTHGHNGFLTAGLVALALAVLDTRPLLAGLCFGLLAYKPQFGVLIPFVLVATGRWRSAAAATVTVALLALAVTAAFGTAIWPAFLAGAHFTRETVLEQGGTGFHKIQTIFAWVRMWGGPVALAYTIQAIVSVGVAVLLIALWRSAAPISFKGAALCIGTLLVTPYALDYDLMILAPALALLAADGMAHGFRPYERTLLALLWFVPIVAREFAGYTHIPIGVPVLLLAFAFVVRAGWSKPAAQTALASA